MFRCAQHYVHILGWCLKMRLLPHVLFFFVMGLVILYVHMFKMVCFAALNTMFISGLVPENEVITTCVIFFVMGLVIEMFKWLNGVFLLRSTLCSYLGLLPENEVLPLYLISL